MEAIYLHGFASSPGGAKAVALRDRLGRYGLTLAAPDLNQPSFERLSFAAMTDVAAEAASSTGVHVLVGSSLGALVALAVSRRGVSVPLVLIAPALGFGSRWSVRMPSAEGGLPVMHYADGVVRTVHREFFHEMSHVDVDRAAPAARVTLIMGDADESVPFATVRSIWRGWEASLPEGSELITIPGGDHGLVDHVDVIERSILRAAGINPGE